MQALQRWGGAMGVAMLASATPAIAAPAAAEAKSMELVAHHELGGNGDGGEGMATQQRPDGRRILYLAHAGQKTCLSVVDVTDPKPPSLLNQLPSPGSGVARTPRRSRRRSSGCSPGRMRRSGSRAVARARRGSRAREKPDTNGPDHATRLRALRRPAIS